MRRRLANVLRPRARGSRYSNLDEESVIRRLLDTLEIRRGWAVDIAAKDGVTMSNTLFLYEDGWRGLAVEGDPDSFAKLARRYRTLDVDLARLWLAPANVVALLEAHGVPREFELLNLDLDGYDRDVLEAILRAFRPVVVCAEINEKIPPPVKFSVTYDPDYVWAEDHFYGQSLSALHELATAQGYALVELHYNSAFLLPAERSPFTPQLPEEAYRSGYLERPDRLRHFPWNVDMEPLHALDTQAKIAFIRERFRRYEGRYEIGA